jgi:predicted site-specific integrase-resolvase
METLKPEQVCDLLGGISYRTLLRRIDKDGLPKIQATRKGKLLFSKAAVELWLRKQQEKRIKELRRR